MSDDQNQQPRSQWTPLVARKERRPAQSETRAPGAQADEPMLTKVANLLDDVTEAEKKQTALPAAPTGTQTADGRVADASNPFKRPAPFGSHTAGNGANPPQTSGQAQNSASAPGTEEHSTVSIPQSHDPISIKGRSDGVAIEIGAGDWPALVAQLDTRLSQAATFFRGGRVALNVGNRALVEAEVDQLQAVLHKYTLSLGMLRTASPRTFQSAVNMGLAASLDGANEEQQLEAMTVDSNLQMQSYFVFRGNLRSGQVLQRTESVLVIGDVNPGGQVISSGDIMIWGRLRGVAHAGAEGNAGAIIAAMLMTPSQLRIAGFVAVSPTQENEAEKYLLQRNPQRQAEIAYIVDEGLVVRPWHEARRGFRSVLLP